MKQELSEIKERLAKTEDLFKKKQKVKYGIAVASCLTTSDMFPSEYEEEEEYIYLDDVLGLRFELQSLNEKISYLFKSLYEHTDTGHLPPVISAGKMKQVLDVLGLSDDYQIQPKTIYASMGGEQTGLILAIAKKAPNSDTPNKEPKGKGTAGGDASSKSGAKVSNEQEKTLQNKADEFNEKESNTKNGRAALGALKSVFQRGLGAFNTSHSPLVKSASQWAFARVNAFLYLLKNGRPENAKYTTDFDLLPNKHPKATK